MPVELAALDAAPEIEEQKQAPYVEMGDDSALIVLAKPTAGGETSITMKRPTAGQYIDARAASKGEDEITYARLISVTTGLGYLEVRQLALGDYAKLREALELLAGF